MKKFLFVLLLIAGFNCTLVFAEDEMSVLLRNEVIKIDSSQYDDEKISNFSNFIYEITSYNKNYIDDLFSQKIISKEYYDIMVFRNNSIRQDLTSIKYLSNKDLAEWYKEYSFLALDILNELRSINES